MLMTKPKSKAQRDEKSEVKSIALPKAYTEALERVARRKYPSLSPDRWFSFVVRDAIHEYLVRAGEI